MTEKSGIAETIRTLLYAVIVAVVFRTFCYEPFNIPSESMVPNLFVGDYLFVSKLSYGYGKYSAPIPLPFLKDRVFGSLPQTGDVVVFRPPHTPEINYIKRLIGVPGDKIQMREGTLYLNNKQVQKDPLPAFKQVLDDGSIAEFEQYRETLPNGVVHTIIEKDGDTGDLDSTREFIVPAGHYFMMGDNRDRSQDSRTLELGFVPLENFVGKAKVIAFSARGNVPLWQFWRWPFSLRKDRFAQIIE